MTIKTGILVGFLSIATCVTNAVAQDPGVEDPNTGWTDYFSTPDANNNSFRASTRNQDNSALRRMEEGSRMAIASSPRNNWNSLGTSLNNTDSSAYIARFYHYNSFCGDGFSGDDYCVEKSSEANLAHSTGSRLGSFNTFSPMAGVVDIANAKAYSDMVTTGLVAPLSVLHSTMNLTEPGIAAGVSSAMNFANIAVTNQFQADNAVLARQKVNPGTGELFTQMYENCIAKQRAQGKNWIQARSECAGGDRVTASTTTFDSPNPNAMMNFQSDPNHPQSTEMGLPGAYPDSPYRPNTIRALDYLFNQERKFFTSGTESEQNASFEELRKSFEGLIGDIEFRITPPQSSGSLVPANVATNPGSIEGTMAIATRRIAPRYGHKTYFRNLVIDRYRDFMALLRVQCEYLKENKVNNGSSFWNTIENPEMPQGVYAGNTNDYLRPSDTYANFWADSIGAHQLLVRLSTTGYQLNPKVVDSVFTMFLDERSSEYDNTTDAKDQEKFPCERLETGTGQPSNLFTLLTDSADEGVQGRKLALNAQDRFRAAFSMSEKVALGQYLGTLAKAEDFIKGLTGGAYDNLIRQEMLELIYSTAGTRDLRQAQDLNDRQLRESAVPLLQWYNVRNGLSSQAISSSLERGGVESDAANIPVN